jgi:hypothetical protein
LIAQTEQLLRTTTFIVLMLVEKCQGFGPANESGARELTVAAVKMPGQFAFFSTAVCHNLCAII